MIQLLLAISGVLSLFYLGFTLYLFFAKKAFDITTFTLSDHVDCQKLIDAANATLAKEKLDAEAAKTAALAAAKTTADTALAAAKATYNTALTKAVADAEASKTAALVAATTADTALATAKATYNTALAKAVADADKTCTLTVNAAVADAKKSCTPVNIGTAPKPTLFTPPAVGGTGAEPFDGSISGFDCSSSTYSAFSG